MNKHIKKELDFKGKKFVLETGLLAFQADMSVKASYGDTVVLVNATMGALNIDYDGVPLMVSYQEKLYASGSIKTSRFVKRDSHSTDEAIITQRLADHAIRPLFPADLRNEIQVAGLVLSLDNEVSPDFVFMNAISACLHASKIPWNGPSVSLSVGYANGEYSICPSTEFLKEHSDLDLNVSFAGDDRKFLAIESESNNLPEEKILAGIDLAREESKVLLDFIKEFAAEVNANGEKYAYVSNKLDQTMLDQIKPLVLPKITELFNQNLDKVAMKEKISAILEELYVKYEGIYKKTDVDKAYSYFEKHALQNMILTEHKRPDGREIDEVRNITVQTGVLPRTHGSALFTRGVTQALTITTLGAPNMELIVQDMYGEEAKRYMHFYNMPPYSSGETGRIGGMPKNREIGHGMLAEKAIRPVLPPKEEFPYTIVVTTEILSSSGSTSMAATCGSTLALMDAGVPIKDMVAGVGVGLIVNDDMSKYLVVTDLAYKEDAYGFMDFKMTGTRTGVTAIQCDIKANGIPIDIIPKIFEQSKNGRMKVLDVMEATITKPNEEVSQYAPKMEVTKILPEDIGTVIGAGGKTIKQIQEKTGAEISIEQDGTVVATAINRESAKQAIETIKNMFREVEVGEILEGTVEDIVDFGAFVELFPGKSGLLHISEISNGYVSTVSDHLEIGQKVTVKVLNVDKMSGKVSLSMKALDPNAPAEEDAGQGRPQSGGRFNDGPRRPQSGRGGFNRGQGGSHGSGHGSNHGGENRRDNRRNRY